MEDNLDFLYDDSDAVKYIKNYLPEDIREKFNDDEIIYFIDLIHEYYDSQGYFDEDDDKEVEINEDELIAFVVKNALSDGIGNFEADDISLIVLGELAYCDSIGIFEE